jgi:hypothetical protein
MDFVSLRSAQMTCFHVILTAVAVFWLQATLNAQDESEQDFFFHELFEYTNRPERDRDPILPLTDAEVKILKGEGYEHLSVQRGMPFVEYAWKRVGIVRAIGFQKQEQWIPILIKKVGEIRWPKSSLEHTEIVCPCVWALAHIGEPSVEPVLKAVATSRNLRERRLLVLALEGIRGKAGAAQLLKERGIDISRPVDGASRPSRRGAHEAPESNTGNTSIVNGKNDPETGLAPNRSGRIIWVTLSMLVVLGITLIWRLKKRRD